MGQLNTLEVYGQNLLLARNARNLSLKGLAEISGYDREKISNLELATIGARTNTLIRLAAALDVAFPIMFARTFNPAEINDNPFRLDDFVVIFVGNMEAMLIAKHITHEEIEGLSGVSSNTISKLLNNKLSDPKIKTLIAIAECLGKSLEFMFTRH